MTKQDFIKKWIGWVSYTNREKLTNEMEVDLELVSQALRIHDVVGSASFVCKNCNHELPKTFSVKTDQYCYLCDTKVTLEECLQKDYPKTLKK